MELYNQYLDRLKKFLSVELVNWQSKNTQGQTKSPKHVTDGDTGGKITMVLNWKKKKKKKIKRIFMYQGDEILYQKSLFLF